jgi:mycothiol synthase
MGIQLRNYRERDLELIVVLLNAAEAVDHVEQGTSIAEQREELTQPGLKPEENVFVAEDEEGRLVAYAGQMLKHEATESGFRSWFNVHPMFRGRGLEDRLLARLEKRARERMAGIAAEKVYFACGGHSVYEERLRAIERAGMKEVRRFWLMIRPSLENVPEPQFPADLIIRSYRMGEDDAEAREADNDAFREHFGHADETKEEWQHFVHSINYRPELTVLAIDPHADRIAGFCHITINEGECQRLGRRRGWIDILGVRREYRRRGLGEALILQGMRNLHAARIQEAALGCDSENTTGATQLYFRVGYQVLRTWIAHDKYLRDLSTQIQDERSPVARHSSFVTTVTPLLPRPHR